MNCEHSLGYIYWYVGSQMVKRCATCGEVLSDQKPRPLKKGDKVRVKGEASLFGEVANVELFVKSYRHDKSVELVHEDGSPILWPDEETTPSEPAWKVWRDSMTRKGECPCGIPEGVCAYHKKSA